MTISNERLNAIEAAWLHKGRDVTHWDGCELEHAGCVVGVLMQYIDELRDKLRDCWLLGVSDDPDTVNPRTPARPEAVETHSTKDKPGRTRKRPHGGRRKPRPTD